MQHAHDYAVIMAGGGGTRLWPFSRQERPKQMLRLGSQRSLFQQAVDRLVGILPVERILVVTVAAQAKLLHEQVPELPAENFLIEPSPRGTASVVGMAALALRHCDAESTMAVVTADHLIRNVEYFHQLLGSAYELARQDYLVTLGIRPTYPATGYGYIERGRLLGEAGGMPAYQAVRFLEKPALERAQRFVEGGNHDWNSGMFIWRTRRIWEEIQQWMPDLAARLNTIDAAWPGPQRDAILEEEWLKITPETVDYGIMERAARVAVLPAEGLGWNDVGAWDSLYEVFEGNENGDVVLDAKHIGVNSKRSLIVSENSERLIVTIGTQDMIVVETKDALLICPREQAQKVRDVVDMLKKGEDAQLAAIKNLGDDPKRYL